MGELISKLGEYISSITSREYNFLFLGIIIGAIIMYVIKSSYRLRLILSKPAETILVASVTVIVFLQIFNSKLISSMSDLILNFLSTMAFSWIITKYSVKNDYENKQKEVSALSYKHSTGIKNKLELTLSDLNKYINEVDYEKLDDVIRKYIPHGFNTHNRSREKLLKETFKIDLNNLKCKINNDRAYKSVGTLGGGNHFIEIDIDSKGIPYLTVHTGSRNLGKQIAEYYQKEAIKYCAIKYKNTVEGTILLLKEQGLEKEIYERIKDISKPTDDLCYLENNLMEDYLHDMHIAQKYAAANRVVILADILFKYNNLNMNYNHFITDIKCDVIECIHNYIDIENKILRKGAISSNENETVIIPINMRDGIILGKGKGNNN